MQKGPQHTAYLAHLDRWSQDDVLTAARAVESLREHFGWTVLMRLMDAGRESINDRLKYGKPSGDATVYVQALGQMVGLEAPKAAVEAVLLKAETVEAQRERDLQAVT